MLAGVRMRSKHIHIWIEESEMTSGLKTFRTGRACRNALSVVEPNLSSHSWTYLQWSWVSTHPERHHRVPFYMPRFGQLETFAKELGERGPLLYWRECWRPFDASNVLKGANLGRNTTFERKVIRHSKTVQVVQAAEQVRNDGTDFMTDERHETYRRRKKNDLYV